MEILPLFRLSACPLVGESTSLHIFEPRYRRMVAHCLTEPESELMNRFGILYSHAGMSGSVGTLMTIDRVISQFEDGSSLISAVGISRFRMIEEIEAKDFPRARVEPLSEQAPLPDNSQHLRTCLELLQELLLIRGQELAFDLHEIPHTAFLLAVIGQLETPERLTLLELGTERERIGALSALLQFEIERDRTLGAATPDTTLFH